MMMTPAMKRCVQDQLPDKVADKPTFSHFKKHRSVYVILAPLLRAQKVKYPVTPVRAALRNHRRLVLLASERVAVDR